MNLLDPVYTLPLINQKYIDVLTKLGIFSMLDLLNYYPRKYLDTRDIVGLSSWNDYEPKTSLLKITENKLVFTRFKKSFVQTTVQDEEGKTGEILWFNQPYMQKALEIEEYYLMYGKLGKSKSSRKLSLTISEYEKVYDGRQGRHLDKITAIYPETRGLTSKWIRSKVGYILKSLNEEIFSNQVIDKLAIRLRSQNELLTLYQAIKNIHQPENFEMLERARKRIAYDEIYNLLTRIEEIQREKAKVRSIAMKSLDPTGFEIPVNEYFRNITNTLSIPFQLTNSQIEVSKEILKDMSKMKPMSRLLHGDVGSGKTIVSTIVATFVMQNNWSVALLCPTTVLAEQHYKSISKFLNGKFDLVLFTGSRHENQDEQATDKPKLFIGTHSLLFKKADIFKKVGLVIVDEQHRFGVEQREQLMDDIKKINNNKFTPHYLMLTATPIPRSVAQVFFGDLEVSYITAPPSNRKVVQTYLVPEEKREDGYAWIEKELENGGQVYVICPLVEISETLEIKNVKEEYEKIQKIFPKFKVELLHGKMKDKEKNLILDKFRANEVQILVSTQVIEVGVDVPNATIIVIESAERFGLAQLHQLRGRVGRGTKQSYCLLFPTLSANEEQKEKQIERLTYFTKNNDGMKLSEYDMMNRGIGDLIGTEQTGLPKFKMANVMDLEFVKKVKQDMQL